MNTTTLAEPAVNTSSYQILTGVIAIVECSEPSSQEGAVWQSFIVESGNSKKRVRCIGDIQVVVQGEVVKLSGHYRNHGDISSYFEIRHCESRQPTEPESIINYLLYLTNEPLQSIRKFVLDLGEMPSRLLDGPEEMIWGTVNGVAEHTVKACIEAWKSRINNGYVLEIAERMGLDNKSLDLFRLKIGDSNSIDTVLQSDPFLLFYHGIAPFQRCLNLSFELGYEASSDQVFAATIYRTLINKYNTSNSMAFSIDELIPNAFRAMGVSLKHADADRLKMDVLSILQDMAGEFISINDRMVALGALHKKEDFVIGSLKKMIHSPSHYLPELDNELLSDACTERFNMDHSVAVYEVISNLEPVECNIINCSFGGLSKSILEITVGILTLENHVYIVCPDKSHQRDMKALLESERCTVVSASRIEDECWPESSSGVLIIYGAHSLDINQWHKILMVLPSSVRGMIVIGDNALNPPKGHGPVYHHLMTDRVFTDYILDTYDSHHPSISRKDELINRLKKKLGISLSSITDLAGDLLIDKMSEQGFESLVEFYTTKVASHFKKDPHKDIDIRHIGIDDSLATALNNTLMKSIYLGSGIIQGKHIAKKRIPDLGINKGEGLVVKNYDATHISIERSDELEKLPINQYSDLDSTFINPLSSYAGSKAWLNILIIGSGDVSSGTLRDLLTFLSGCEKCIIAGDFDSIDRLLRIESNTESLLCDLGFDSYIEMKANAKKKAAVNHAANLDQDEGDTIIFD